MGLPVNMGTGSKYKEPIDIALPLFNKYLETIFPGRTYVTDRHDRCNAYIKGLPDGVWLVTVRENGVWRYGYQRVHGIHDACVSVVEGVVHEMLTMFKPKIAFYDLPDNKFYTIDGQYFVDWVRERGSYDKPVNQRRKWTIHVNECEPLHWKNRPESPLDKWTK